MANAPRCSELYEQKALPAFKLQKKTTWIGVDEKLKNDSLVVNKLLIITR